MKQIKEIEGITEEVIEDQPESNRENIKKKINFNKTIPKSGIYQGKTELEDNNKTKTNNFKTLSVSKSMKKGQKNLKSSENEQSKKSLIKRSIAQHHFKGPIINEIKDLNLDDKNENISPFSFKEDEYSFIGSNINDLIEQRKTLDLNEEEMEK